MASSELGELVGFLESKEPQLRTEAARLLYEVSGDPAVATALRAPSPACRLLALLVFAPPSPDAALSALKALTNFCACESVAPSAIESSTAPNQKARPEADDGSFFAQLGRLRYARSLAQLLSNTTTESKVVGAVCMLLTNLTQREASVRALVERPSADQSPRLNIIMEKFFQDAENPVDHLAYVLMNCSHLSEGQDLILQHSRAVDSLLSNLTHPSTVRRIGCAATLKHLLFREEFHPKLAEPLIGRLCVPLVQHGDHWKDEDRDGMHPLILSANSPGKKRESELSVRRLLVESLYMLASTRHGRELLRKHKAYPVLREADKEETDDELKDLILKFVEKVVLHDEEPMTEEQFAEVAMAAAKADENLDLKKVPLTEDDPASIPSAAASTSETSAPVVVVDDDDDELEVHMGDIFEASSEDEE